MGRETEPHTGEDALFLAVSVSRLDTRLTVNQRSAADRLSGP
jgi:hypothetical protein